METLNTLATDFNSLISGSTHKGNHGIAGTNNDVRRVVWDKFVKQYPDKVTVKIKGETVTLKANTSVSGKSTHYFGSLTKEAYIKILGNAGGLKRHKKPSLTINNGEVVIDGGGSFFTKIPNSLVELL